MRIRTVFRLLTFSGIACVVAVTSSPATADEGTELPAGKKQITRHVGVDFEFRWCPPGEFLMGSPKGAESKYGDRFIPQRSVKLTRGFWMQATEVTQSQYVAVMGSNPSFWKRGNRNAHPVERVRWDDAVKFCNKLTELDPAYEYRLPTEAEWEYACRAGQTECRYGDILKIAWVFMNTDEGEGSSGHRPVGKKLPNKWGFHDLFGNVAEWCADWHAPAVRKNQTDPRGPGNGELRVVRGDDCFVCWTFLRSDGACMAGSRSAFAPSDSSRVIGFRVVKTRQSNGITE